MDFRAGVEAQSIVGDSSCGKPPGSLDDKHSFSCLKIICGNLGHGVDLRACYIQRVLPFVLSAQRHSHQDPEGLPLSRGLPHGPRCQRGLHRGGQQHRHALPVLPAAQPDEEVQLRGEDGGYHCGEVAELF